MATKDKSDKPDGPQSPGGKRWARSKARGFTSPSGNDTLETIAKRNTGKNRHAERHKDWGTYRVTIEGKMAALCRGELSVDDMDNEELARMQFRAADGSFKGRAPGHLPAEVVRKAQAEILRRGNGVLWAGLILSREEIVRLSTMAEKESDRIRAAMVIEERLLGKAAEKVNITADSGFMVTVAHAVRRLQPEEDENEGIVDADI